MAFVFLLVLSVLLTACGGGYMTTIYETYTEDRFGTTIYHVVSRVESDDWSCLVDRVTTEKGYYRAVVGSTAVLDWATSILRENGCFE